MNNATRCVWQVTAGLIPGEPLDEYTRFWTVSSTDWYDSEGNVSLQGLALFQAHLVAAQEYARTLCEPNALNWVQVNWIWY